MNYKQVGDYKIPNLHIEGEELDIGRYGEMRSKYLWEHHMPKYMELFETGTLRKYLHDLNLEAKEQLYKLIDQMAASEGITEELKNQDTLAWVGAMNNIKQRAEEIILKEFIYPEEG